MTRSALRPYLPIIVLIVINLLLTPFFIDDYGENWDDNSIYLYGEDTVEAYARGLTNQEITKKQLGPFNLRYYGPVYFATSELASRPVERILSDWNIIDQRHLINFLGFQVTLVLLFILCRRVMDSRAAFIAVLLFETQPLIWGHAIINPKDIPFLTFFLATIVTGLAMVDQFMRNSQQVGQPEPEPLTGNLWEPFTSVFQKDWAALSSKTKRLASLLIALALAMLALLYLGAGPIQGVLEALTRNAYTADASTLLGKIFQWVAPNAAQIGVDSYVQKSIALFMRFRSFYLIALPFALLGLFALLMRDAFTWLIKTYSRLPIKWIRIYIPSYTLLAAIVLGASTAVRILGPAAGGLVGIYFLWKAKFKSIPALLLYGLIAAVATYWGWPYLWEAPFARFEEVVQLMSDFPWIGAVLFGGQFIPTEALPHHYLITLMGLQLTVPIIVLCLLGVVIAGRKAWQASIDRPFVLLLGLWFFLPLVVFTLSPPRLYDNFRQLLFLLPPAFVFGGLAIDAILKRISSKAWSWALITSLILPGVVWIFLLHPYQYVFYNALVGGVGNAYTRYEMDYWVTSFQETAEYLNDNAPENAQVIVYGPEHIVRRVSREDLLFAQDVLNQGGEVMPDYAVMTTRHNWHIENYPDAPVVFEVTRFGALFAVVKYVGDEN